MGMSRRGHQILLLIPALSAALLLGCSSNAMLDGSKLERNISTDAAATDLQLTAVSCPRDREAKSGDRFQCTAMVTGGATLSYDVTITSAQGDYTYALAPDQAFDGDVVAKELTQDISTSTPALADAKAVCPKTILSPGGKATFTCTVVTGGQSATLTVTKEAGKTPEWQFEK